MPAPNGSAAAAGSAIARLRESARRGAIDSAHAAEAKPGRLTAFLGW
jgi:hypothetical protein